MAPTATVARIPLGKSLLSGGVSIKQMAATTAEIPVLQKEVEPLTQERVEVLWQQVGEALGIADLTASAKPELQEHSHILLHAQTTLFSNDFKPHKMDVVQWLREQTGLRMLDCSVKVRYVEKDALPYSPDDKYQYMLKQNPNLAMLRQLFPQIDY